MFTPSDGVGKNGVTKGKPGRKRLWEERKTAAARRVASARRSSTRGLCRRMTNNILQENALLRVGRPPGSASLLYWGRSVGF